MDFLVLVTYATRYGSTEETAQAVAQTLRDHGIAVEFRAVKDVPSVDRYGAVVLGAALYMGRLHKDARRFLAAQRDRLATVPVALFVPGPVDKREKDWTGAQQQVDKALARHPWLKPVACEIVGGAFDPKLLGFPFKLIPAIRKIPASDARDWTKIRHWASALAKALQPCPHETLDWPGVSAARF